MQKTDYIVLLITTATVEEAQQISELLLEQRKAACVNIVPKIDSRFWWKGKLESTHESLMVVKTKASLLPEIINLVKGQHSYTVPEIIALPIIGGNPDYLKWIDKEIKQSPE